LQRANSKRAPATERRVAPRSNVEAKQAIAGEMRGLIGNPVRAVAEASWRRTIIADASGFVFCAYDQNATAV
jgi:hypothetical protein